MARYLLDTNVFIEAYKRYYSEKITPSFWQFLEQDNEVFTIKEVIDEIKKGNDSLPSLIAKIKIHNSQLGKDATTITDYIYEKYEPDQVGKFLDGADYPLVCITKAHGLTVVTHEQIVGEGAKKISIPNICKEFSIKYLNTFEMLEDKNINLSDYLMNTVRKK